MKKQLAHSLVYYTRTYMSEKERIEMEGEINCSALSNAKKINETLEHKQ